MNRSFLAGVTSLLVGWGAAAAPCAAQATTDGPRLVVLISVDQFRADLIDRFAPMFTGGFKRLREEGYRFTEMSHAHANTETAVGHATLSTGVYPSRSGIVANEWTITDGAGEHSIYSVEDLASPIVGYPDLPGRSPKNLLRGGLADWVLAADPEARVAAISLKDRAAISFGGKTRGEVYWLNTTVGRFVTSTYYHTEYPEWVKRFNEAVMPGVVADTVWNTTVSAAFRGLARADTAAYEGDGVHTAFPHYASQETTPRARISWLLRGPAADRAVGAMARAAAEALQLGQRGHVDFLGISFSSTDYVGHSYGPLSQEQLDNIHRLDGELEALFTYLDEHVGKGRWVVGLTADHGVMTMPEYLAAEGEGAQRVDSRGRNAALNEAIRDATRDGGTQDEIADRLKKIVEERGLVTKAYTHAELLRGEPADSFATFIRNSMYPGRPGGPLSAYGVEFRFGYHDLFYGKTGTSHGTPYWYDRHVPFVLMGPGVAPGESARAVYSVDVVPTLAALAGIPVPPDLDGTAILR
jgi:predicted AlkP superfamily pyrophosphatase or phosphodiesterase